MKICKDCKKEKCLSEFYGSQNECKECTKARVRKNYKRVGSAYDETEHGVIRVIYKTQVRNSKTRGHNPPSYTKSELKNWLYKNGYKDLYKKWNESGNKKDLKPSVDRINDHKPYTIENIRLVTWGENRRKQYKDGINGTGTTGQKCKEVKQYDMTGTLINKYHSQAEASRKTGIDRRYISMCCNGKVKHAKGFVFTF